MPAKDHLSKQQKEQLLRGEAGKLLRSFRKKAEQ